MQSCINANNIVNLKNDISPTFHNEIEINNHKIINRYPIARWKHATVIYNNYLYLMGGYSWTNTLKDLWRLNLNEVNRVMRDQFKSIGVWSSIGDLGNDAKLWEDLSKFVGKISPLQSHTMVAYKNRLYIFGGAFTYDARNCPFWIYDIGNTFMQKWKPIDVNVPIPTPRRNHSCCIYRSAMVIFGGFGDVRGSLGDLWAFDFETKKWHLIWCTQFVNRHSRRDIVKFGPRARHDHRAVVHNNNLLILGGMCGLEICNDLWQWSFDEYQWTKLLYKGDHSDLSYITDVKISNHWLLFGINETRRKTEKWIYSFSQNKWTTRAYNIPEFYPFCTLSWFSNSDSDILCDQIYQNKTKLNKIHPSFINSSDQSLFESINLQSCCIRNSAVRQIENYQLFESINSTSKETMSTDLTDNSLCETTFIHSINGEKVPNKLCNQELLIILGNNIDRASFDYHLNIQMLRV